MKKYRLLLLSILLLIATFVYGWFNDQLIGAATVLIDVPFFILLVGCCIALLVGCIKRIIGQRAYIEFLSVAVLALLIVMVVFFPFRKARVRTELALLEAKRLTVVDMVRSGELKSEDGSGNVVLPRGYKPCSASGEVYVFQNDGRGQVIAFWVFRGVLSGSVELVYSTGGEALIRANEDGHPIATVEQLKDNWYYVITED